MFKNLFKPDSGLMIFMSRVTDCIFLSLFFILACVPVVTIGAALAALYDSSYRGIRRADRHSWQRFLEVFRENWKVGILPTILVLALSYGDLKLVIWFWNQAAAAGGSWMAFSAAALVGVLVFGVLGVLFPMLSRFENSTGVLLKNTVLLSLANLPRTLLLGMVNAAVVMACAWWVFPVFFLPAFGAFLSSFLLEPMFRPYMPEEEETEILAEEEEE